MAGETGFFTDDIDEPLNNFKRTHTFRSLCCDLAWREEGKMLDWTTLKEDYCLQQTRIVFERAHAGEELAHQLLETYIDKIVRMLNKVDVLLDPDLIVIGGDICQMPHSETLFLQRLNERFRPTRQAKQDVCYSKYGPLVTLYGAGQMALDHYVSAEFPYIMGNGS